MSEHDLKVWPEFYWDMAMGRKTFEVRKDDRRFKLGDTLVLKCFNPKNQWFDVSAPVLKKRICYILTGGQFGIEPGYVVMGLEDISEVAEQ